MWVNGLPVLLLISVQRSFVCSFRACLRRVAITTTSRAHERIVGKQCPHVDFSARKMRELPGRERTPTTTLSTTRRMVSASSDEIRGPPKSLSKKLVKSLDLMPLMERVAEHAATKRGREALLSLVGWSEDASATGPNKVSLFGSTYSPAQRKTFPRYSSSGAGTSPGFGMSLNDKTSDTPRTLPSRMAVAKIATSAAEAKDEYELVRQAFLALRGSEAYTATHGTVGFTNWLDQQSTGNGYDVELPPIYGASSSPWDVGGKVPTDDDDWLDDALMGRGSDLDLESILQADQVVKRLLETHVWANSSTTRVSAGGLSRIGLLIEDGVLRKVHEEICGAVEIVRGRSILDPTGRKSFSFRLSGERFASLKLLRRKERDIMEAIDNSVKGLLNNRSFSSNLLSPSGAQGKPEAFELDGRIVVPAQRTVASSIGVVRGFSKKSAACYVEPRQIVGEGDELLELREEIEAIQNEIKQHLVASILRAAPFIEAGLDVVARIDAVFARAAFGCTMNGVIPQVGGEGRIHLDDFVHPVLALREAVRGKTFMSSGRQKVVPIDLKISSDKGFQALVISGPNGGGKTVALKSFGLSATMCKLGIPILCSHMNEVPRVDFFNDILVEVGDEQSVAEGESTMMARLNACSQVIQRVTYTSEVKFAEHTAEEPKHHSLVLIDELGGGTDPTAGAAIATAVLEKLLESDTCRVIATTHSPQLKVLSVNDDRYNCATVLLQDDTDDSKEFKLPTFKLAYGRIGDSYALGAASRATPSLPDSVLARAAELMAGGERGDGDILMTLSAALERENESAQLASRAAENFRDDAAKCRDAMLSLARAYEQHFSRLENRLETVFNELRDDESKSGFDVVGETLAQVRLVKKRVKSEEELLAERGLKRISYSYKLTEGEQVVILANGEWEGETATVVSVSDDNVVVNLSYGWGQPVLGTGSKLSGSLEAVPLTLKRAELAVWDYPGDLGLLNGGGNGATGSVSESKLKLYKVLSSVKPADDGKLVKPKKNSGSNSFTSARERKAARAEAKKGRKRKGRRRT